MKLVHISDIHIHDEKVAGSDPVEQFRMCLAQVEANHSDADAVVITGDLSEDGNPASYERLRALLEASPLDIHLMIGNHDHRANFRVVFSDRLADEDGFIQYTVDAAGHRLVMLDTCEGGTHSGRLCEKRLAWLSRELAAARRDSVPVLLFMHHNPAPVGVWSADILSLMDPQSFRTILHDNRDIVRHLFFGHTHYSLSGTLDGVGFSAPRSTNHPCWPEFDGARRAAFGPIAPNYNLALIEEGLVVVHTVDFMLEDKITWLEIDDPAAWAHNRHTAV